MIAKHLIIVAKLIERNKASEMLFLITDLRKSKKFKINKYINLYNPAIHLKDKILILFKNINYYIYKNYHN